MLLQETRHGPVVPQLGNPYLLTLLAPLFTPRSGGVIETPGKAAALSMGVVLALSAAVVGVALLKKKKVI